MMATNSRLAILSIVPALLVTGCQTIPEQRSRRIFQDPAQFVGRDVIVCGTLSGTAKIYDWDSPDLGLSIDSGVHGRELVELGQDANACLAGKIFHLGCKSDPDIICTDADNDYGIRVEEVLKAERLPEPIDLRRLPS